VALEQPNGLVVDRLLEAGLMVVPVHPNQLAAARDRYRAGGGKSDGFDSYVLAELARTDMHRLRALEPDSDQTRSLRALTRAREDLVQQRVSLANQLRAQLEAFWPGAGRIFCDLDSPISLAFLERSPSPLDARGLGEQRLARFLARHRYPGGKRAGELLARLRRAPSGRAGALELQARRQVVLALVAALRPLVEQIKLLTRAIRARLAEHADGQIFRSLFLDPNSVVTAAACFRWACNKRLRTAVGVLAEASRKHNPWARTVYANAIARGHDHAHALRILGRAWLRVIWRMWQDRAPYDPTRHGSLQALSAAGG